MRLEESRKDAGFISEMRIIIAELAVAHQMLDGSGEGKRDTQVIPSPLSLKEKIGRDLKSECSAQACKRVLEMHPPELTGI